MADIGNTNIKYWNWILSTGVNNWYSAVVNFDIEAPTYSHYGSKLRETSYYYKKRKWYNDILPITLTGREWEVTDMVEIPEWACLDAWGVRYIMLVNMGAGRMHILAQDINEDCDVWYDKNGRNVTTEWLDPSASECFCSCQYDRFIIIDYVKWTPRLLNSWTQTSVYGNQINIANGTVGAFFDDTIPLSNGNIWDWIYTYGTAGWENDAVCGMARQIVQRSNTWDHDISTQHYLVNAPWSYIWVMPLSQTIDLNTRLQQAENELRNAIVANNQAQITAAKNKISWLQDLLDWENGRVIAKEAHYSIYPEWWEVPMYQTCDWLKTIHTIYGKRTSTGSVSTDIEFNITTACGSFSGNVCTYSVNLFNNRINLLGSSWYNLYGWLGMDKMSFSVDNQNYVGADKQSQAVFRNFLVQFGRENMSVIVYNENWQSFNYKLDSSVGIWTPTSWITYQNSLYIIASDKRLYSCDIQANGSWGYQLILTDQSQAILWELDLLSEWDDVNMSADGTHIYIFINNKSHRLNTNNTKTRILKFYKDYNKWVTHDICANVLKRHWNWYYFGDGLYRLWSTLEWDIRYKKDWDGWFVNAYIEFFVWENEETQTNFTTLNRKQLQFIKILLGKWIYTDWNTKIVIDSHYNGFKQQYMVDKFEHIDWVNLNNQLRQGLNPEMPECMIDSLAECSNIVRECKWAQKPDEFVDKWCYYEPVTYLDNCICLDDDTYELSDIYNVWLDTKHLEKSDLFRVRIISSWWDEMYFGWLIAWAAVFPYEDIWADMPWLINNWDDCCVEWKHIDRNDLCWCSV